MSAEVIVDETRSLHKEMSGAAESPPESIDADKPVDGKRYGFMSRSAFGTLVAIPAGRRVWHNWQEWAPLGGSNYNLLPPLAETELLSAEEMIALFRALSVELDGQNQYCILENAPGGPRIRVLDKKRGYRAGTLQRIFAEYIKIIERIESFYAWNEAHREPKAPPASPVE